MEEQFTFSEVFNIIKKRIGLVISMALIGLIFSSIFTFFVTTTEYNATTQLLVNRTQTNEGIERSDIDTNVQLINTYKDIIQGPVILDDVQKELNLEYSNQALSSKISIGNQINSQVFSLTVTDENPYNAALIANTIATTFQENIVNIMNVDNVTIISSAIPNTSPVSPNVNLNLIIGLLLGSLGGIGLTLLLEVLDKTVKDENFIVDVLHWNKLGFVSEMTLEELKTDERVKDPKWHNGRRSSKSRV